MKPIAILFLAAICIIALVIIYFMFSSTTASTTASTLPNNVTPGVTPVIQPTQLSQCTKCGEGWYSCPASVIKSTEWYNGQESQVSSYRLSIDPTTPPITIDGKGYYFRQLGKCT